MKRGNKAIAVTLSLALATTGILVGSPVKSDAKTKIALNKKKVTLTVGKSVKLKLKGTGKKAKWSSSNENVAMVSSSGKVMALKAGKTKITAKIKKKKYFCNVTVKKKAAATPEETARVIPTRMPFVVQTPVPVTTGKTTNAPAATRTPAGTGKPSVSGNPAETNAPVDPGTPDKPEETKAPVKPDDQEKPETTKAPEETKAPTESGEPEETKAPVKPRVVYQFAGRVTGWGGPDTYPSSKDQKQGDGESNSVNESLTNIKVGLGSYKCGLELMNKYSENFTGASNELSQIIKGMTDPVIRVTLENGGTASGYNWYDELKCPSGEEVSLTKEFLANEYFGLFGNDDTITKVEIYDRATTVVEPENPSQPEETKAPVKTEKPEETEAPENPSQPNESYTPDIPVVTPGSEDVENETLASNMKASLQRLANGSILLKVVNNNDVTVNYFHITVIFKDAQGNVLTWEDSDGETYEDTSSSYGWFLEKNGLYYDYVYPVSANEDKVDLSKSEISIEVGQTLWEDNNYTPLTSKIAVTTQKQIDEDDGSSQIAYEIKNNDSKDANISMMILFKDVRGNVVGVRDVFETVSAGNTYSDYVYGPYDDNYEDIDFASYEVYISGYMHEASES